MADRSPARFPPRFSYCGALQSLSKLGPPLDLAVIADGVDTREACDRLTLAGWNLMQGYLFGPPGEDFGSRFLTPDRAHPSRVEMIVRDVPQPTRRDPRDSDPTLIPVRGLASSIRKRELEIGPQGV